MSNNPNKETITFKFLQRVQLSNESRIERYLIPVLMAMGIGYSGILFLSGDMSVFLVSALIVGLLVALSVFKPLQKILLNREMSTGHAFYLAVFWLYSQGWIVLLRQLQTLPQFGKDSIPFYVLFIFFMMVTYRGIFALFGITFVGYSILFTTTPFWERVSIAINEVIAGALLSFFAGGLLAQWIQPNIFTRAQDPAYTIGVFGTLFVYYFVIQLMWTQRWNSVLSQTQNWLRLARLFAPIAVIIATMVIGRHFARLSDPRTADLLGTANLDQTILAISPVIWLLLFMIVVLVYTSNRGLSRRFLPIVLLEKLPTRIGGMLTKISDMDLLLVVGILSTWVPVQVLILGEGQVGIIDRLRTQITQQNALIDTSEQALALIFALPFYGLALSLLLIYAYVLIKPELSAKDRDAIVDRLPNGLLIMFIITLYLCSIPFSQVLSEGRIPQLPQDLGRILAFDVLIPLVLLYGHYFILVRIPYGRGQKSWREQYSAELHNQESRVQSRIKTLDTEIDRIERRWINIRQEDEKIETLYKFVELNSNRDSQNMDLLRLIRQRQELDEVSETPLSAEITRLPTRIISLGIPLLLIFKIYEWAVVNNGLREIANNPNIGVIEFFQIILQQTQF
jgi:hypothetical protein